jgi:hypothetical protein
VFNIFVGVFIAFVALRKKDKGNRTPARLPDYAGTFCEPV